MTDQHPDDKAILATIATAWLQLSRLEEQQRMLGTQLRELRATLHLLLGETKNETGEAIRQISQTQQVGCFCGQVSWSYGGQLPAGWSLIKVGGTDHLAYLCPVCRVKAKRTRNGEVLRG